MKQLIYIFWASLILVLMVWHCPVHEKIMDQSEYDAFVCHPRDKIFKTQFLEFGHKSGSFNWSNQGQGLPADKLVLSYKFWEKYGW